MPLPRDLSPMLATAGRLPPDDDAWAFEVKWDGVRVLAAVEGGAVRLTSRAGNDVTGGYPELQALAGAVDGPVLLDGEVVAFDEAGRSDFGLLQGRMHVRSPRADLLRAVPVHLVLFDLLAAPDLVLGEPYDDRAGPAGGARPAGAVVADARRASPATAAPCSRPRRRRGWRASSPSGATAATSPGGAATAG